MLVTLVTPEYLRVRGEIARLLLKTERKVEWGHCGTVDDESWRRVERRYLLLADQVLSIKGLAFLSDDQTAPCDNIVENSPPNKGVIT